MDKKTRLPRQARATRSNAGIPEKYASAFGQAFAAFVEELTRDGSGVRQDHGKAPVEHRNAVLINTRPATPEELDERDDCLEITERDMAGRIASCIAVAVRGSGVAQRDIAAKLKVNPSVVTRILQRPERSSITKLCEVANAAGVRVEPALAEVAA